MNYKRCALAAITLTIGTLSSSADEWWYAGKFPLVYSTEDEWNYVVDSTRTVWVYSMNDRSWYYSFEYIFEEVWWYVEHLPYMYNSTFGWIYIHTEANNLNMYNFNTESFQRKNLFQINPEDMDILSAKLGDDFEFSSSEAFQTIAASPSYSFELSQEIPGLFQDGNNISGTPETSGVVDLFITARHFNGFTVSNSTQLVIEADTADLPTPTLPANPFDYESIISNLPDQYTENIDDFGDISDTDNTPNDNPVTNAGATLGRVLFYDKRLSLNNSTSCASCHKQESGFTDERQVSLGFEGGETGRNSMSLSHARFYGRERFFWDERADTLEDQVLMPIQSSVEMGMNLSDLRDKLGSTSYYPDLFEDAFGSTDITNDRIAQALAQFVRAMVSTESKFDQAFSNGILNTNAFTDAELEGLQLFSGNAGIRGRNLRCSRCHETIGFVADRPHNIGLDITDTDDGAGNGEFKVPSLRNVAVSAPYMHDGRFATLREVIEHYDNGVQDNPNLANRLRGNDGNPERLNLSESQKDSLIAFLETLTDEAFLSDERFSDPFEN